MSIKPIRCLLLAAGFGTRLRPLTETTPKCLVEVGGKPLLANWIVKLKAIGCEKVLINTHYLAANVEQFIVDSNFSDIDIELVYEPTLLGTAGTLLANHDFFRGSTGILIHADNAMLDGLEGLLYSHRARRPVDLLTMLTFKTDSPSSCGIIEYDQSGQVIGFHEKVAKPPGDTANGAIYVFDDLFINHLKTIDPPPQDFSIDVIPTLLNCINTWHTRKPYFDIGTPSSLELARRVWRDQQND